MAERVAAVLTDFLDAQRTVLAEVGEELAALLDAIGDLLAGGKRLRPLFCYWGYRGTGAPDTDAVVAAAASLEMFHAAALVHDDVMDGSDTRRGLPAAHRRFATLHRQSGWRGSDASFGIAGAILLGDLALTWSDQLFAAARLDAPALTRGRTVFDRMRTELMGGQYLDMLEQVRDGGSVSRARRVIRYKSAKYTVEQPLLLGGALAGADAALLGTYSAYGMPLGEAFQLRDDVLGVFGDPGQTGKPAGDDLREGKRTVLVAMALEHATTTQSAVLHAALGDPYLDADGVATARQVLVDTGALTGVERMIESLTEQAVRSLDDAATRVGLAEPALRVLAQLAEDATVRVG